MERDTALVFESLAEALRAKELIDAAGKPKYWLTFVDRVKDRDGAATRQGRWAGGRPNPLKRLNDALGGSASL